MRLTRQLFGATVRLEISGDTKEEVIQWRDYFFNWGAMQISEGNDCSFTSALDKQENEVEDLTDTYIPEDIQYVPKYRLAFAVKKDKLIKAFEDSAEAQTDWENVLGKRNRQKKHLELHAQALARFEAIPASY